MAEPVDVRRVDQDQINKFSALNRRLQEIEADSAGLKTQSQDAQDAVDELLLADEDDLVHYKMGECFVMLPKEEAEERLEARVEELDERQQAAEAEIGVIKDAMAGLKVELYGRFGKSINLDE